MPAGRFERLWHPAQFLSMKVRALGGKGVVGALAAAPRRLKGRLARTNAEISAPATNLIAILDLEIFMA
jgi:hypothetical protein